jgi:hypothetical protein
MSCAPGLIFGATEGVGSRFHVLRARTSFRRYRGRPVPFSYFARSDSFLAVLRASGAVFIFCAPRLVFDGTERVGSRLYVLRARTYFRRYRWRLISVFMLYAAGLIFDCTEGVRARFYVVHALTHFWRYQGLWVPFSYFALPDSF